MEPAKSEIKFPRGSRTWGSEAEGGWVSVSRDAGLGACWGEPHQGDWERKGGDFPQRTRC